VEGDLIHVDFSPDFRTRACIFVKYLGVSRATDRIISFGYHPSFVRALIRSIMGKEGW
jgi:hypothetical protein